MGYCLFHLSWNSAQAVAGVAGRLGGAGSDDVRTMRRAKYAPILHLLLAALALAGTVPSAWPAPTNRYGVAVIVGNKAYSHERVPEVAYAHRDAEAFRRYVLDVLGFAHDRVFDLRDATQAQMFSWFGNRDNHEGRLWRYLHPRHGSDVVVFYSGHGVPGLKDKRGYLLPADADPDTPEINGYPIDLLYTNLGKLVEAKSIRVFVDACFSGESDRGMLIRSASPVMVTPELPGVSGEKMTVLTAASGRDVASWDEQARHGMFTHHLLDALYGKGDLDGDGEVTALETKTYLDDTMTIAARVEFGRNQYASLNGVTGVVLARAGDGGAYPLRPSLEAEAAARAEQVRVLLARCSEHVSARRLAEALGCFLEVLSLDPDNAQARAGVRSFGHMVAWIAAEADGSVEEYHAFEQAHPGSKFVILARDRLKALEDGFWTGTVRRADTREGYLRYLEIYPRGAYAQEARRHASGE